jgi:hypothetical protein
MAHMWFAYALVYTFTTRFHWVIITLVGVTFVKEFIWDKHQEQPGQTFHDDLMDWVGYLSGVVLAFGMLQWYSPT